MCKIVHKDLQAFPFYTCPHNGMFPSSNLLSEMIHQLVVIPGSHPSGIQSVEQLLDLPLPLVKAFPENFPVFHKYISYIYTRMYIYLCISMAMGNPPVVDDPHLQIQDLPLPR